MRSVEAASSPAPIAPARSIVFGRDSACIEDVVDIERILRLHRAGLLPVTVPADVCGRKA